MKLLSLFTKNPNATAAGGTSVAAVAVIWAARRWLGVDLSNEEAAGIVGGAATVVLAVGRKRSRPETIGRNTPIVFTGTNTASSIGRNIDVQITGGAAGLTAAVEKVRADSLRAFDAQTPKKKPTAKRAPAKKRAAAKRAPSKRSGKKKA